VPLDIHILETPNALEALAHEWRHLWEQDPAASPFEGPDWLLPWTRHLWGGGRLRVLEIRAGGDLVAVAPLFLWGYGRDPQTVSVSLLGAGISDYLGMTAAPEFAAEAAGHVYEWLAETADEWHVCDLQELRPGSPLLRVQPPPDLKVTDCPSSICPVVALPGDYETLCGRLDAHFRRNLRTAEHRLASAGSFEIVHGACHADELIEALFRLHEARWQERGESGVLAADALRRFHQEAVHRLAQSGTLRLLGLRLNGEIIAVQYNLYAKGCCYYYLSGFDPRHARYSPGALLIAYTVRLAFEEGARELDFLRQAEPFKYQWGAHDRTNRRLMVTRGAAHRRNVA
jgi:CelD/BcsL family acetyltransferase involved in cellulose biosynthesis